jgi:hypothetical protein
LQRAWVYNRSQMQSRLLLIVLVWASLACGRYPLGLPFRDAASTTHSAEPGDGLGFPEVASEPGPAVVGDHGPEILTDACIPLTCRDPGCSPAYCGRIGDGCGDRLDCGACATGWSCKSGQCQPDVCKPIACDTASPFPYCGKIGDGCGGTLNCICPQPEWLCVGSVCNATSSGCVPLPGCMVAGGGEYCGGLIGDGCGGVLDCSRACSSVDFICKNQVCVDTRPATPPPVPPPPPTLPPPPPPPPCPPPPSLLP